MDETQTGLPDPDHSPLARVDETELELQLESPAAVVARSDLVLDCLPKAVVITDLEGTILAWNRVAEELYCWDAEEVLGRSLYDVALAESEHDEVRRIMTRVAAGETWNGDLKMLRHDGEVARTISSLGPLRADDGQVVGTVSTSDDVISRRTLEQEAQDLTDHLQLALAAGELGTWRWDTTTGVNSWDATLERLYGVESGTFGSTFDAWAELLHPDDVERSLAVVERAIEEKTSFEVEHRVVWPDGSVHWLHGRGTVILDAEGNVTGTIGCVGDVTARKLLEIDAGRRARDAERLARRERVQRERLEFLARVNDAAAGAVDHRRLMHEAAAAAIPHLGDWCAVYFIAEPGAAPEVEMAHANTTMIEAVGAPQPYSYDPRALTGVPAVIRSGRTEFLREVDEAFLEKVIEDSTRIAAADELRSVLAALQITSVITVPLRTNRGVVGAMRFVSAESKRRFDDEDVRLAQAAADRVAEALDNAWLTEQQRHIAATLQGALLPPRLPEIEGLSVAVRYWAAGGASQVGGDFYDVFGIGDGRWAIVIGDVCGTGPNAAAVIAIARHTIRAAAKHGADHRAVLDWLNDALHAGNRDLFCTAVFSTLERIDGRAWRYTAVAGGHPLPVVVRADGTATTVGAPGTLLGVMPAIEATSTEVNLGPGDTLVLYTDGLTDVAPPHDLEPAALLQLMSQAAATDGSADDVAARLGALVESVLPIPERNDDLALVVVRAKPDEHEAAEGDENR